MKTHNRFLKILAVVISLLFSLSANAEVVKSLYVGIVPVANQSKQVWQQGVKQALEQVLVKVSGNSNVASVEQVQNSLANAKAIVRSYNYENASNANSQAAYLLRVRFDPNAVKQILKQGGQGLWGRVRPLILVWLVVQNAQGRSIVTNDNNQPLGEALAADMNNRGLPYMLPMMDLQDLSNISVVDIWQLSPQLLAEASARYHPNDILAGRVYQTPDGKWHGDWLWIVNNQYRSLTSVGDTAKQVVSNIVTDVANTMAARFAVLENNVTKTSVKMRVFGVTGLDDYAEVIKYLKSLTPVSKVEVSNVEPDDLVLNVITAGGEQALMNAISQGNKLEAIQGSDQHMASMNELNFRWLAQNQQQLMDHGSIPIVTQDVR